MRKITLFAAAVAVLALLGIDTWLSIRTLTPTVQLLVRLMDAPMMMTGAKGLPTSPYDDYEIVAH